MPWKWLILAVVVLRVIGDEFPFSDFPMYSNFDHEVTVVYLADGNGNPLPTQRVVDTASSQVKKRYKAARKALGGEREEDGPEHDEFVQPAAHRVLDDLAGRIDWKWVDRHAPGLDRMVLRRITCRRVGTTIEQREETLGEREVSR